MAGVRIIEADANPGDWRIAIVASRYNGDIVDRLLQGCIRTLTARGVPADRITVLRVPGAFEIPIAVKSVAERHTADAVIAIGAVIRGETAHFEYIAAECSRGIAGVPIATGVPVGFGVLTVDTMEQALDRSGGDESNKGSEAAAAALEMIGVLRKIAT